MEIWNSFLPHFSLQDQFPNQCYFKAFRKFSETVSLIFTLGNRYPILISTIPSQIAPYLQMALVISWTQKINYATIMQTLGSHSLT